MSVPEREYPTRALDAAASARGIGQRQGWWETAGPPPNLVVAIGVLGIMTALLLVCGGFYQLADGSGGVAFAFAGGAAAIAVLLTVIAALRKKEQFAVYDRGCVYQRKGRPAVVVAWADVTDTAKQMSSDGTHYRVNRFRLVAADGTTIVVGKAFAGFDSMCAAVQAATGTSPRVSTWPSWGATDRRG